MENDKSIFGRKMWKGIYLPRTVEGQMKFNDVICGAGSVPPQITSCLVTAVICKSEKLEVLKGCKCGHAAAGHGASSSP
jgi:hypothetical protein